MVAAKFILLLFIIGIVVTPLPTGYLLAGSGDDRVLIGFLPYWTITSYDPPSGLFDYIVFFDAPAQSDGSIDTSYIDWYLDEIRRVNASCGCTMLLAITCFNADTMDQIMAYHREEFIQNILDVIETYGFAGVNIDFEFMRDTNSYTGGDNTDYFLEVLISLKNNGVIVSFDIAGSIETVYRDSRLNDYVDFVFLMGYDYHWSNAPTTGPVSPLKSTELDVDDSLDILDNYYDKNKIILGLPLYGYDWPASSPDPYTSTTGSGTARTYRSIRNSYYGYGVLWDDIGHVPWIRYQDNGGWRQIWFDNITSLAMKIDYVIKYGYGGFGFWALGYEDGADDEDLFWDMVVSRRYRPYINVLEITYSNGSFVIKAINLTNVESLNITIVFNSDPGAIDVSYGDLGEAYDYRDYIVDGVSLKIMFRREGFPGIGLSGTGVLAYVNTSNLVIIDNVSVSGGNQRIVPGEEFIEPLTVNETIVVNPVPPIHEPYTIPLITIAAIVVSVIAYLVIRWLR